VFLGEQHKLAFVQPTRDGGVHTHGEDAFSSTAHVNVTTERRPFRMEDKTKNEDEIARVRNAAGQRTAWRRNANTKPKLIVERDGGDDDDGDDS